MDGRVIQGVPAAGGQEPHWAYSQGMSRLSCSFCIMANKSDLRTAAKLRRRLFEKHADLEARIGHTFSPSRRPLPAYGVVFMWTSWG